jgi:uncharacterized protein (TIGR03663 family)
MSKWKLDKRTLLVYGMVLVLAAGLRFVDLTAKPFHHDESLYGYYSWVQERNGDYHYDPMMHGPVMFFVNVVVFRLLGAGNFTARLGPALFGTLLCLAPLLIRRQLGRAGTLLASLLFSVSPIFTYFSRFLREDIYAAFFTFLAVAFFIRFLDGRKSRELYFSAASLSLLFCTKENAYLHLLIFATFGLVKILTDRLTLRGSDLAFFRGGSARAFLRRHWMQITVSLYVFFGVYAALYTNFGRAPQGFLDGLYRKSLSYWFQQHETQRLGGPFDLYLVILGVYSMPVLVIVFIGYLKNLGGGKGKILLWVTSIFLAAGAPILLGGNRSLPGLVPGFLSRRFTQLHLGTTFHVYLLLLLFFIGGTGTVFQIRRGRNFRAFLIFWSTAAFFLYSYAGEKVPWLSMHILLPLILLAASYLEGLTQSAVFREARVEMVVLLGCVLLFQLHNTIRSSLFCPANPEEMIVYTQTTPEMQQLVRTIRTIADGKKLGENLPMCVEGEGTWPLSWYLRNYKDWLHPCTAGSFDRLIMVVDWGRRSDLLPYLQDYYDLKRYRLRAWWIVRFDKGPKAVREFFSYFFLRRIFGNEVGSTDIAVFFRKDIRDPGFFKEKKLPKPAEPREKAVELRFLKMWGKAGQGNGEFLEPRDIAVTEDGFVYVADTKNDRIQKFSSDGGFLLSFGSPGSGKGQFKEPTGVGVDREGTVYVADTWNHRIQVFDADGKFLFEFKGGNEGFWAPKDVAVDSRGDIYVTDTGYHRIQKFSEEGKFLLSWGGKGEAIPGLFSEPVGLFVDAADTVWVADTGNHRIQHFTNDGKYLGSFATYGWEHIYAEPYLAIDPKGRIWVSDSTGNRLELFTQEGAFVQYAGTRGTGPGSFDRPTGICFDRRGNLYVSDTGNNRVDKLALEEKPGEKPGE